MVAENNAVRRSEVLRLPFIEFFEAAEQILETKRIQIEQMNK